VANSCLLWGIFPANQSNLPGGNIFLAKNNKEMDSQSKEKHKTKEMGTTAQRTDGKRSHDMPALW
jgi:hypothetical protein